MSLSRPMPVPISLSLSVACVNGYVLFNYNFYTSDTVVNTTGEFNSAAPREETNPSPLIYHWTNHFTCWRMEIPRVKR